MNSFAISLSNGVCWRTAWNQRYLDTTRSTQQIRQKVQSSNELIVRLLLTGGGYVLLVRDQTWAVVMLAVLALAVIFASLLLLGVWLK